MIKQIIDVNGYWKVIVYYDVNYNLFDYIAKDLRDIKIDKKVIERVYNTMKTRRAKAATLSNTNIPISVVLFNAHTNKYDYINSIVHEAEHIKQYILRYYNIEDKGEKPAYTIGYLVMKMIMFLNILC